MSTAIDHKLRARPESDEDIYRIGWRDILRTLPDGSTKVTQVPLTLEDALHPQEGDHIVNGTRHDRARDYLAHVSRARTHHDPMSLVTADCGVYWDDPALDHHSPDIAVIFNVRDRDKARDSFNVAAEGTRPRLMFEVVSPSTRKNDVETKVKEYHQARVPLYVIVDRVTREAPWQLRGYQWAPDKYLDMPKDERGRLWLEPLGVWLEARGEDIVCYDGATGQEIPDYLTLIEQLKQQTAFAEAEKTRAEAEKTRAEAEKARAEAETQARQAAEERLRDMEAELARLRGQNPA